ncbi:MAG: hypothetical protein CM1200mP17_07770 [Woeseia sp.]|nr:MAG: hypothetical protein CM1200mP17_07770 [Woeseia sp.]
MRRIQALIALFFYYTFADKLAEIDACLIKI